MYRMFRTIALSSALCIGLSAPSVLMAQDSAAPAQDSPDAQAPSHGGRGGMSPDRQLDRLTKSLNLTSDQQSQIKPILQSSHDQMMQVRQDSSMSRPDKMAKMKSINDDSSSKVEAVLTDEQKPKYEQMLERRKAHMHGMRQGGAQAPDGGDQTAPPPSQPQ